MSLRAVWSQQGSPTVIPGAITTYIYPYVAFNQPSTPPTTTPTSAIVTSPFVLSPEYILNNGTLYNYYRIQGYTLPAGSYTFTSTRYAHTAGITDLYSYVTSNKTYICDAMNTANASFSGTINLRTTTTIYPYIQNSTSNGNSYKATNWDSLFSSALPAPPAPSITSVNSITPTTSTISFTQSLPGGTAGIYDYEYSTDGTNYYSTGQTTSPLNITNAGPPTINGGTSYTIRLRALYYGGSTAASSYGPFIFYTVPTAPTSISWQQASSTSITVSFTAGSNGGTTITNYEYSLNGGSTFTALSPADGTSPITVPGLSINTAYTLALRAINASGTGLTSTNTSIGQINLSAPTLNTATITNGNLVITLTAPTYTGGYTITNYAYTINNSTYTAISPAQTSTTLTIGGITFTSSNVINIKAITSYETGPASATTVTITTPGAPTSVSASVNGSNNLVVSYVAPGSNGGAAITDYQYSFNSGSFTSAGTASTSFTITSPSYIVGTNTVVVRAVNPPGAGTSSSPYNLVLSTPSAPTISGSTSVSANGTVTLYFTAPGLNGGLNITNYSYSFNGGSYTLINQGTTSPFTITGLTYGTPPNTIALKAVTPVGSGTASSTYSFSLTVPGAPTLNSASPDVSGSLTLSFTAGSNGGLSITNYAYSTDNGSTYTAFSPASTASPVTIIGATYSIGSIVKIRAINQIGQGADSNGITLSLNTPSAPLSVGATIDSIGTLNITFTTPSSNGGLSITDYYYSVDGTTYSSTGQTSSPIAVTYSSSIPYTATNYITLKAYNSIGQGAASSPAVTINLTTPTAPTITSISINEFTGVITLGYTVPVSNGGIPIINYKYQMNNTGSFISINSTSANYLTISGATFSPTSNSIRLQAVNKVGDGSTSASFNVPISVPSSPTSVSGTIASATGYLTISATTPSNGGLAITNYYVSFNGGTLYALNTITFPAVYTNTATIPYNQTTSFVLYATNALGNGPASSAATFTTSAPSAPTIISQYDSLNLANTINLVIQAPSSNGGLTITNYRYSLDNGSTFTTFSPAQNGTTTLVVMGGPPQTVNNVLVIGGLTERVTYSLIIQAINLGGTSASSNMLYFKFMCFLEGTKLLCYDPITQQEVYRCVETLRKGDLVKTLTNGYKAVDTIGTSKIYNPGNKMRSDNRLYRCSKNDYPSLFEDLIITGCHSILVDGMSKQEMLELIDLQGTVYMTEGKCRLTARVDRRTSTYEKEGLFNIWHLALENHDLYSNYGVYANGLLVETSSKRMMNECSGMNLL